MGVCNLTVSTFGRWRRTTLPRAAVICGLCLLNVALLGYSGAGLVFGSSAAKQAQETLVLQNSPDLFNKYCSACHPGGGNKLKARFPLINAPQLAEFETFLAYIRAPKARDGAPTLMIQFPAKILSETEARTIYEYIVQVLKKG